MKAETLDRREEDNMQKQPYKGTDIQKFDRQSRINDRGQRPKR